MKTKGRRQSKNVEDDRSPVANAIASRQNAKNYPEKQGPFGSSVDLSPREQYRANQAGKGVTEAKGPFKRMVGGMEGAAKRFSREQAKTRVIDRKNQRGDYSTMKPDKNGKLRTIVKPKRRTKD